MGAVGSSGMGAAPGAALRVAAVGPPAATDELVLGSLALMTAP